MVNLGSQLCMYLGALKESSYTWAPPSDSDWSMMESRYQLFKKSFLGDSDG